MHANFRGVDHTVTDRHEDTCPVCKSAAVSQIRAGDTAADDFPPGQARQIWSTVWTHYQDFTCENSHAWIVLSNQDSTKFKTLVPTD